MKYEVYKKFLKSINFKELLKLQSKHSTKNSEYTPYDEEIIHDFLMYGETYRDSMGYFKLFKENNKLYLVSKNKERVYEFVGNDTVRIKINDYENRK